MNFQLNMPENSLEIYLMHTLNGKSLNTYISYNLDCVILQKHSCFIHFTMFIKMHLINCKHNHYGMKELMFATVEITSILKVEDIRN